MGAAQSAVGLCARDVKDNGDDREEPNVQQVVSGHTSRTGCRSDPLADECIASAMDGSFKAADPFKRDQAPAHLQTHDAVVARSGDSSDDDDEDDTAKSKRTTLTRPTVVAARMQEMKVITSICCHTLGCK
mmetsp:Transcript_120474/g.236796  ORF Transcript_120474/g.236796 Transcript_120474/m.236796 type:complete len:131 (+) Transcript_120474:58-450(+)